MILIFVHNLVGAQREGRVGALHLQAYLLEVLAPKL